MSEILKDIVDRINGLRMVLKLFSDKINYIIEFKEKNEFKKIKLRNSVKLLEKIDIRLYKYSLLLKKILSEVIK